MQFKDIGKRPSGLLIMMLTVIAFCLFFSTSFAAEEKVIKVIKSYPEIEDYKLPCLQWYGQGAATPEAAVWHRPDNKVIGIIDSSNVAQYKQKGEVCDGDVILTGWGLKLNIIAPEPGVYKGSKGYYDAQAKTQAAGGAKLSADNSLENYFGGLPFPNPKSGVELAWNRRHFYNGDTYANVYCTAVLERKGGSRVIGGGAYVEEYEPRVDLPPLGGYTPNPEKIEKKELDTSTYPPEVNGLNVLLVRYQPNKEDDMWMYVPTMRRVRRFSTAQRCDSYGGSHHTYDDFWVFNGKVQNFDWKLLGEKEMYTTMQQHVSIPRRGSVGGWGWTDPRITTSQLVAQDPALPGTLSPPDFNGTYRESIGRMENCLTAKRPTYIIECVAKDPKYLYSKRIIYMDKETNIFNHSECYDRKGQLWKYVFYLYELYPELVPGKGTPNAVVNAFVMDVLGEEGDYGGQDHPQTQNYSSPPGPNIKDFSIEGLRRLGH